MCGFVGILTQAGRGIAPDLLARMAAVIRHRGPDGEGEYRVDGVAFRHLRLAIIDLEGGAQPMTSGPYTIAYNGEIYNYVELREELRARGHIFRTESDTEVILRAYAEWGDACVTHLGGMFAFLLHDAARGRVLAARDHFGIKPLYWAALGDELCFASEIKALLEHPRMARRASAPGLQDYLTYQFILDDGTLFDGIRKVPPGHYLTVELAGLRTRAVKYWAPSFVVDGGRTQDENVARLRERLAEAVRLQTRSDVPVGTYLSGGTDSTLVTMLASPHLPKLHAFTGAFREGPEFNELTWAQMAARATGAELHEVFPAEQEFCELMPRLVHLLDEPVAGPGVFPQYAVARLARQHVKVVLGGQGGDEIFGGYARYLVAYVEQALKGAIFQTNEEQEHIVSLRSIVPNLPALRQYVPMLKQFWSVELFEPMDRRYFRLIDRSSGSLDLLSADFREQFDREAVFGRFQKVFNNPDTLSYYNKMTHFDMVAGLPALLHVEDRVSMAHGLESRVPLLDRDLAELVAAMPPAMKFKGGELKYILKRAARNVVPAAILDRPDKMGFPVPLQVWARGRSRDFFADVLLSGAARSRGLYDARAVEQLIDREEAFGRRLWGLLNLELWHRQFIDWD